MLRSEDSGDSEALAHASILTDAGLGDPVLEELRRITRRPVRRHEQRGSGAVPPSGPLVYVGPHLPDELRTERLVWFHSTNAGVDALLSAAPWPERTLLTRTVGRMGDRIAQYVLAWILAECQEVPAHLEQQRHAEWRRLPSELAEGRTALVYGAGRIGARVGALLRACGIRAVGVARTPRNDERAFDESVTPDDALARLGEARWVVSALPLTSRTAGFFDAATFGAMRGATFINVGRGATVDLAGLGTALDDGSVRAAVLDVLPEEPPGPDHTVWKLPRTVITSHSAGITAPEDVSADFASCWRALLDGRTPELAVDPARGY
ncbi:NAD(P)-dependent oxidoreductase [Streptomyces sp. NPDC053750]|uniref:NAD(P)-dependent oxidoreductase n=1 Tax=Streptomyces sp. NPDC053750 TaxID=3365714 RepID=UPI0037D49FC3